MALLLRQACQPILNDYDLDAYHADIDKDFHMCLFTPCGKQFAVVHGVNFSRKHPTQAEIDFATDLLIDWCARNKDKFEQFIEARTTLDRIGEAPNFEVQHGGYVVNVRTRSEKEWVPQLGWVNPPSGITVYHKNTCWYFNFPCEQTKNKPTLQRIMAVRASDAKESDPPPTITGKEKVPAKVLEKALERHEEIKAYKQACKAVEEIQAALNTCHG